MTKDNPTPGKKSINEKLFGQPRPVIDLPRTSLDNILEALAVLGLVTPIYYLVRLWPQLPNRIPTHFGAAGAPDAWGGKESLVLPLIIGLFIYALLTGLSFFPQIYNYPVEITPANAERQYRLARGLILWMKVELLWLFGYISWSTIQVTVGSAAGLGKAFLPITLVVIFGTVGIYFWRSFRQGQT